MIDQKILNEFSSKINHAHQQFCIWWYANNEFAKHQGEWNKIAKPGLFTTEEFSRDKGCEYKNFWDVVIPSLQHSWILSLARLFDPPYFLGKKEKPRLSIDYILGLLDDAPLVQIIRDRIKKYNATVQSLKVHRDNFLAHNSIDSKSTKIEAGVEGLFEELDNVISDIKGYKPYLQSCNNINLEYTEILSRCGVEEIFEALTHMPQIDRVYPTHMPQIDRPLKKL